MRRGIRKEAERLWGGGGGGCSGWSGQKAERVRGGSWGSWRRTAECEWGEGVGVVVLLAGCRAGWRGELACRRAVRGTGERVGVWRCCVVKLVQKEKC